MQHSKLQHEIPCMYICKVHEKNAVPCESHEVFAKVIWYLLGGNWLLWGAALCELAFGCCVICPSVRSDEYVSSVMGLGLAIKFLEMRPGSDHQAELMKCKCKLPTKPLHAHLSLQIS